MKKTTLSLLAIALLSSSSLLAASTDDKIKQLEADNEEMWSVIEKVETKAFTDKLNMSFELRGRMDKFSYDNNGIGKNIGKPFDNTAKSYKQREMNFPQEKQYDPQYSVRGLINMNAKTDEGVKFTGRIRFDHSSQGDQRLCILSPQHLGAELPASSSNKFTTFDVDRAFVDVPFMHDGVVPLTLTGGILPTTGGMSSNIIENTPRRSVFPTIMFDSNVYGGIATANLSNLLGIDTYVRAIVGKGYTLNDNMFYYQCNRENIQNNDVAGIFAELKIPLPANIDNTFWIGYNNNANIKATPFLGGAHAENKYSNTNIKYQQDLGSIANYGAGWELRAVPLGESVGTLDLFAHYSVSDPSANGNCVNYTATDNSGDCNGVGKLAVTKDPSTISGNSKAVAYYDSEMARGGLLKNTGQAVYTGFKYTAPWDSYSTKFGYEFNYGSKYWWSATQGSEDIFNKIATRGNAHEVYVSQNIAKNVYVRVGYLEIDEKFTGSGWHFGKPDDKDAHQKNLYALFNAYF